MGVAMRGDPEDVANGGQGWLTGRCECRVCSNVQVSVWPASTPDPDNLECSHCGFMTAEPVSLFNRAGVEEPIDGWEDSGGR